MPEQRQQGCEQQIGAFMAKMKQDTSFVHDGPMGAGIAVVHRTGIKE